MEFNKNKITNDEIIMVIIQSNEFEIIIRKGDAMFFSDMTITWLGKIPVDEDLLFIGLKNFVNNNNKSKHLSIGNISIIDNEFKSNNISSQCTNLSVMKKYGDKPLSEIELKFCKL